ncbi:unnamed protein product [Mycena citricolor]|uniref:Uncharacterized protein n=1 Tax=Mycena citricolor TaxID=2018698 RepID=A0AAD2K4P7_9AGAR|nr:unnamed protein product [Mycena citricolor]
MFLSKFHSVWGSPSTSFSSSSSSESDRTVHASAWVSILTGGCSASDFMASAMLCDSVWVWVSSRAGRSAEASARSSGSVRATVVRMSLPCRFACSRAEARSG